MAIKIHDNLYFSVIMEDEDYWEEGYEYGKDQKYWLEVKHFEEMFLALFKANITIPPILHIPNSKPDSGHNQLMWYLFGDGTNAYGDMWHVDDYAISRVESNSQTYDRENVPVGAFIITISLISD